MKEKRRKKSYLGRIPIPRPGHVHRDESKIIPRKRKYKDQNEVSAN